MSESVQVRDVKARRVIEQLQLRKETVEQEFAEVKDEEETLREQRIAKGDELHTLQRKIRDARKVLEKSARNGDGSSYPYDVKNRALIEYMEFVKGIDIDSLRTEIVDALSAKEPTTVVSFSTSLYDYEGVRFVVRDGVIEGIIRPEELKAKK